jgi:hypothetical protein
MDEVDSIGSARTENSGGGGDSEVQRTMLELLNQLDGFEASNKIKVGVCRGVCLGRCGTACVSRVRGGRTPKALAAQRLAAKHTHTHTHALNPS